MEVYRVNVDIAPLILTLSLGETEWSNSCTGHITPGERVLAMHWIGAKASCSAVQGVLEKSLASARILTPDLPACRLITTFCPIPSPTVDWITFIITLLSLPQQLHDIMYLETAKIKPHCVLVTKFISIYINFYTHKWLWLHPCFVLTCFGPAGSSGILHSYS